MKLTVNGKPVEVPDGASVARLMETLGMRPDGVAVEVNRELVVKKAWATTSLNGGDRVEIVTLVGGG
jgi:sulfur carrier protein